MVGGGPGALIGESHRAAAKAAGFELVAGAFSSKIEISQEMGAKLRLNPARVYATGEALIEGEAKRKDGAQAIIIATPNHLHAPIAMAALRTGMHVICDKPLCFSLKEAQALAALSRQTSCVFGVTYSYSGYAAVRRAREMVEAGEIGALRFVNGEFVQDWLSTALERQGVKLAEWRMDPQRSGLAGTCADLGTHLWHLAEFITGVTPAHLSAELATMVEGRELDDTAMIRMRYANGARGQLTATQATPSSGGHLFIRVYGEKAGIEWHAQAPYELRLLRPGGAPEIIQLPTRGTSPEVPNARPLGIPWAFEALYVDFAKAIRGGNAGYPDVIAGLSGMAFIEAAVRSSAEDGAWIRL